MNLAPAKNKVNEAVAKVRTIGDRLPLSSGCTSESGTIKLMKWHSKNQELKNLLMANYCFKSLS